LQMPDTRPAKRPRLSARQDWTARIRETTNALTTDEPIGQTVSRMVGSGYNPPLYRPGDRLVDVRGIPMIILWRTRDLYLLYSDDRRMCEFACACGLPPPGIDGHTMATDQLFPFGAQAIEAAVKDRLGKKWDRTASRWIVEVVAAEIASRSGKPCPGNPRAVQGALLRLTAGDVDLVMAAVATNERVVALTAETAVEPIDQPTDEARPTQPSQPTQPDVVDLVGLDGLAAVALVESEPATAAEREIQDLHLCIRRLAQRHSLMRNELVRNRREVQRLRCLNSGLARCCSTVRTKWDATTVVVARPLSDLSQQLATCPVTCTDFD
jgi:hypothetical protein